MVRCTGEERALARASVYRLLALAFSYPTREVREAIGASIAVAEVGATLLDGDVDAHVRRLKAALEASEQIEADYQHVFTLSYSEDCPPYETAFSANHIFQQSSQQADIAGFFRAFGVTPNAERVDHLAMELEFMYLLTLKESRARSARESEHIRVTRSAQRNFMKQHLARWAPLIGQRVAIFGAGSAYEAAGRLLVALSAYEERFLRLGTIDRYRDEPLMIADEPGEFECPMEDASTAELSGDLPVISAAEEARDVQPVAP